MFFANTIQLWITVVMDSASNENIISGTIKTNTESLKTQLECIATQRKLKNIFYECDISMPKPCAAALAQQFNVVPSDNERRIRKA